MDGTLVDTEPYWFAAERELMGEFGLAWSDEEAAALVGNALLVTAGILAAAGVRLEPREIVDRLIASVVRQVRERIHWRPGARELLAELRDAGIPCGLVTMSEQALVVEIVRQLPAETFRVQVTGEMVSRGKPDPEPYLRAAHLLEDSLEEPETLDMRRMVAIEDSIPGVTAGLGSGAATIGVPNIVELPPMPGLTLWPTLAGRTVADLETLVVDASTTRGA